MQNKLQKIKEQQKALIESLCTPEPWVKQEIITIVDEQISAMPELDRDRFIYSIRSMEHPEGFVLKMDVHPCLRIREGVIVRDSGANPEGFFWPDSTYQKMKKKAKKNYFVGGETGEYLENFVNLRNKITNPEDGKQLSFKVARGRAPLEVFELPAEQRTAVLVTKELAKALGGKLLASYNMVDPKNFDPVEPGDLLVQDIAEETAGLYYRVDMKQVSETYRRGTLI
jgi:hypothetical protein